MRLVPPGHGQSGVVNLDASGDVLGRELVFEHGGDILRVSLGDAVNNYRPFRVAAPLVDVQVVRSSAPLLAHEDAKVGPVAAVPGDMRSLQSQHVLDVFTYLFHCSRSERHDGNLPVGRQLRSDQRQAPVRLAKVVAPLRQAVRLVYRDQTQLTVPCHISQPRHEVGRPERSPVATIDVAHELLRGHVHHPEIASECSLLHGLVSLRGTQERGEIPFVRAGGVVHVRHLVVHE
mmetsp:Transcript_8690/g.35559  ORF Transcript_8690/g.35559 Transcript_8690/m.35559 type:complete len:233 (-) Transcript_8690:516-1214(-)